MNPSTSIVTHKSPLNADVSAGVRDDMSLVHHSRRVWSASAVVLATPRREGRAVEIAADQLRLAHVRMQQRIRARPAPALLAGLLLLSAAPASAQTVRGILLERDTYELIDFGTVYLLDEDGDTIAAALTDEEGLFRLHAAGPGSYRVIGHAFGYLLGGAGPFELEEDALRVVELSLVPAPIAVEGLDVEVESRLVISDDELLANGFYERMLEGRGQFLTPEDLENSDARYTPMLLRGMEYVRPQYGAAGWQIWPSLWNPYGSGRDGSSCTPHVWVDDVWVNREGYEQYPEGLGLEDVVPKSSIKALELYWGMQAPLRYSAAVEPMELPCGALLIWTK